MKTAYLIACFLPLVGSVLAGVFGTKFAGKGYALEAAVATIDYAFDLLGWDNVIHTIDPDNAASIRLLERLGFKVEGHLRAEWETHIGVRDSLIFGLLKDEWLARRLPPADRAAASSA